MRRCTSMSLNESHSTSLRPSNFSCLASADGYMYVASSSLCRTGISVPWLDSTVTLEALPAVVPLDPSSEGGLRRTCTETTLSNRISFWIRSNALCTTDSASLQIPLGNSGLHCDVYLILADFV